MNTTTPPLSPQPPAGMNLRSRVLLGLGLVPPCVVGLLVVLRLFGLLIPFLIPTGGMAPAVVPGDHVLMEGFTYLVRGPGRGDVVVFRTKGIASLPEDQNFAKRVAGEPGDHVQLSDGKLFVNGKLVLLSNAVGQITYKLPPGAGASALQTDVVVPSGHYFVLGDNATNSLDSRFWGSLPRRNIRGRIAFCYWPLKRVGGVR